MAMIRVQVGILFLGATLIALMLLFPPYRLTKASHRYTGCDARIMVFDPLPLEIKSYEPKFNGVRFGSELGFVFFATVFSFWVWSRKRSDKRGADALVSVFLIG